MRVYFNTSALNRPLDDLSSERVRMEAEAVVALLAAVEDGTMIGSDPSISTSRSSRTPTTSGYGAYGASSSG
jgi:hypothetical protein